MTSCLKQQVTLCVKELLFACHVDIYRNNASAVLKFKNACWRLHTCIPYSVFVKHFFSVRAYVPSYLLFYHSASVQSLNSLPEQSHHV